MKLCCSHLLKETTPVLRLLFANRYEYGCKKYKHSWCFHKKRNHINGNVTSTWARWVSQTPPFSPLAVQARPSDPPGKSLEKWHLCTEKMAKKQISPSNSQWSSTVLTGNLRRSSIMFNWLREENLSMWSIESFCSVFQMKLKCWNVWSSHFSSKHLCDISPVWQLMQNCWVVGWICGLATKPVLVRERFNAPLVWLPGCTFYQHAWWADQSVYNILFGLIPAHTFACWRIYMTIVSAQTSSTGLSCVGVIGVGTAGCFPVGRQTAHYLVTLLGTTHWPEKNWIGSLGGVSTTCPSQVPQHF